MFAKLLVAIRKAEDIDTACRFLRGRDERPRLVVSYMKLPEDMLTPLRFVDALADRAVCEKYLEGFDFEIIGLEYLGDKLSASVYAQAAARENCDSILVVSDGPKLLFATDLAATLAVESTLPVMVLKS